MEEAETLSDRVIIVDHGKVIATGTPSELIRRTGVETAIRLTIDGDMEVCVETLRELPGIIKADGVDAYHKLMWDGRDWTSVLPNTGVLAGFAILFFIIGIRSLRWD